MTTTGERGGARTSRSTGDAVIDRLAAAGWDELVAGGRTADPLRRTTWLRAWAREAGAAVEHRCVIVDRDRAVAAAAPLESLSRGGLRLVRHLGQGDAWFDIAPPAVDDAARADLLAAIAAEPGDILLLDGMGADEVTAEALRSAIPRVRLSPAETWRLELADPPRSMRKRRKEAGRARRRAAERGVVLAVDYTDDWPLIERRLATLLDFHAAHFPGDGPNLLAGAGVRRRFAEEGIRALGAEGRARLVQVTIEGGPMVAWDLALVGDGASAIAYAGAFDRSRDDLMTLGWISMLALVEGLGAEGVAVLDFGPGPAPYKDLIARAVPLVRATAPLSARGRAALAAHRAAAGARARLRARRGAGEDA
ncbi:GNAT family N-acetyltransferase [Miltoncostaea marina]|uniref:GNAT family N-acetyltransferase n=1 Tax=Miltoncostaea marina TaxID=2843215 RepID=UPI001C3C2A7D|nr:GNAT family N-acetyltransferase [Miltoncostaea marina]